MNVPPFQHRHAAHCESGVISTLFTHHGATLSEAMAFGLASALSFAYLPFIKLSGLPLIAYRMPPQSIIKGVAKLFETPFRFETFRNADAGMRRLDALLGQGKVVGLQTSVFWLPYFPEDMRFHFNAHNLLVYGKEGDDYLISDPVFENPVRSPASELKRARFAKGVLAPKGLLYYPEKLGHIEITPQAIRKAIKKTTRIMLSPIPIVGVRGIRMSARAVARLNPSASHSVSFIGHIVRMQEEIGTGGAGFRFLYAAFLQEAASIAHLPDLTHLSGQLNEIGDVWREFALKAARMVKGRDAVAPKILAAALLDLAEREREFIRSLKRAVA